MRPRNRSSRRAGSGDALRWSAMACSRTADGRGIDTVGRSGLGGAAAVNCSASRPCQSLRTARTLSAASSDPVLPWRVAFLSAVVSSRCVGCLPVSRSIQSARTARMRSHTGWQAAALRRDAVDGAGPWAAARGEHCMRSTTDARCGSLAFREVEGDDVAGGADSRHGSTDVGCRRWVPAFQASHVMGVCTAANRR